MKTSPILSFMAVAAMFAGTSQTFAAGPAADAITFAAPKATYATGGTIALAGKTKSGASITYSTTTPDYISISGATATIKKAGGPASITATAAAPSSAAFTQAPPVTVSFPIAQAKAPTFTATASNLKPTYTAGGTVTVTPSSLPSDFGSGVTYTSTGPVSVSSSGVVTLNGGGAATVTVTPPASINYLAPKAVVLKITVVPGVATISPVSIPGQTFSVPNGSVTIPTPASLSTGAFTYTTKAKTAKIAGNVITFSGAGPVDILATQAADSKYAAVKTAVTIATVVVNKANDSIDFTPISSVVAGGSITVPATSKGGVVVVYTINPSSLAAYKAGKITVAAANKGATNGATMSIVAGTAGSVNYNAVAGYTASLSVGGSGTVSFSKQ